MPINDLQEEDDLWEEFKKTKSPSIRENLSDNTCLWLNM